jgi:hypothetical protein
MKDGLLENIDERTIQITGRIATIFLGLTQVALVLAIFYRRYLLGQYSAEYRDIQIILLVSILGYFAARLYYAAFLPVPSLKAAIIIYVGMVVVLFIILSIWLGLPDLNNWRNNILPVVAGPAVLVGLYHLFAYLGKKRAQKDLE